MILRLRRKLGARGFTLIEVMIVVAIVGLLAAVAVPVFINFVRRSKASEVNENLDKCYKGVVDFYNKPRMGAGGNSQSNMIPCTMPRAGRADAALSGSSYTITYTPGVGGTLVSYRNIDWIIADPVYGAYQYVANAPCLPANLGAADLVFTNSGTGAFQCEAFTDLDTNGVVAHWLKGASWMGATGAGAFQGGSVWHDNTIVNGDW